MAQLVVGNDILGPWIAERTGGAYVPGDSQYLGLERNGRLVAVTQYSACNGASLTLHCAGEGNWLNREFLWTAFDYPFNQLGVNKLISPVESGNVKCRKFIENIGFTLEATLKNAAPSGDLLLYTMERGDCPWLFLKRKPNEQAESTSST